MLACPRGWLAGQPLFCIGDAVLLMRRLYLFYVRRRSYSRNAIRLVPQEAADACGKQGTTGVTRNSHANIRNIRKLGLVRLSVCHKS